MAQENSGREDLQEEITRGGYRVVFLWAAAVLVFYGLCGFFGVRALEGYRAETEKRRLAFNQFAATEPPPPAPETKVGTKPIGVDVGVYINSIGEFELKESGWTADFDIWFRWRGGQIRPGETFQVVNGEIRSREKREVYAGREERYERYQVKARLTKFFDPARFPFSDAALTIQVEDGVHGAEELRYVADERESGVNRLGVPQGLSIKESSAIVKYQSYESARGDPRISPNRPEVRSRFIFAMLVSPLSWPIYLKIFQGLFASVAIAFIVFFIRPIHVDPRFGLGVGAVFAAVGNNISAGAYIPVSDRFTLTVLVNGLGFATIFLTLVQSTISLYIEDTLGEERLRRLFDHVSFAVFLLGYAAVNLILPFAAMS